jgi:glycosyltransferase involved in cell wall biosynthesis
MEKISKKVRKISKKILVICQHYWPEPFRITDLCEGLVENNYEVEVLCGQPNYPSGQWVKGYGLFKNTRQVHNGVKIRRTFEIKRGNNTNLRIFLNYICFPIASFFHLPYLMTQKYDKILLYQLSPVMMSITGIILGKIKKIETTMYVLDLWPQNLYSVLKIKNRLVRSIAERVSLWHYNNVDKIVTISNKMRQYFIERINIPKDKICFIPQYCEKIYEIDIVDEVLAKRFTGGFNIVFTGNLSPAQSFETIIEVAKRIKADGINDINWIIVGDGMSREQIINDVYKNKLDECFYFEGYHPIEDIPKYTNIANALIACLAKSDMLDCTIPAKVMSYLASGRPLLLAMDGEIQDIVKDAECGYTCNAGDVDALYNNTLSLYYTNKSEREYMGLKAREYHFKHFERNINLKKLITFLSH